MMLLSEIGKLREERRAIQQCVLLSNHIIKRLKSYSELGSLLYLKSKYGPGGEFNPDW